MVPLPLNSPPLPFKQSAACYVAGPGRVPLRWVYPIRVKSLPRKVVRRSATDTFSTHLIEKEEEESAKMKTLLLKIQDDADVARGAAILRGEEPVPKGVDTIQLFVASMIIHARTCRS